MLIYTPKSSEFEDCFCLFAFLFSYTMPKSQRKSQTESMPSDDLRQLILGLEAKIMSRLDSIEAKVSVIDSRLDRMQAEQIRLKNENDQIKDLVISQQRQIERMESTTRVCNAIFSGVPENSVGFDNETLTDDKSKVQALCIAAVESNSGSAGIGSCVRIGDARKGHNRLLKVTFENVAYKRRVMTSQRRLRESDEVTAAFGKVYVNPDSSFLMRKEEKRLREKLKELKTTAHGSEDIYIRRGTLYRNSEVIDRVNIINQLF